MGDYKYFTQTTASTYNMSAWSSWIILHRAEFSTRLECKCLRTSRDVSFFCLSFITRTSAPRAAHVFNTPVMVPAWQQQPVAVELQIVWSALLTQSNFECIQKQIHSVTVFQHSVKNTSFMTEMKECGTSLCQKIVSSGSSDEVWHQEQYTTKTTNSQLALTVIQSELAVLVFLIVCRLNDYRMCQSHKDFSSSLKWLTSHVFIVQFLNWSTVVCSTPP